MGAPKITPHMLLIASMVLMTEAAASPPHPDPEDAFDPEMEEFLLEVMTTTDEVFAPRHPSEMILAPPRRVQATPPSKASQSSFLQLASITLVQGDGRDFPLARFLPSVADTSPNTPVFLPGATIVAYAAAREVRANLHNVHPQEQERIELRPDPLRPGSPTQTVTVEKRFLIERYSVLHSPLDVDVPWTSLLGSGLHSGRLYLSPDETDPSGVTSLFTGWVNSRGQVFTGVETWTPVEPDPAHDLSRLISDLIADRRGVLSNQGDELAVDSIEWSLQPGMSSPEADLLAQSALQSASLAEFHASLRQGLEGIDGAVHATVFLGVVTYLIEGNPEGLPELSQSVATALALDPRPRSTKIERLIREAPLPLPTAAFLRQLGEDLSSSAQTVTVPIAGVFQR